MILFQILVHHSKASTTRPLATRSQYIQFGFKNASVSPSTDQPARYLLRCITPSTYLYLNLRLTTTTTTTIYTHPINQSIDRPTTTDYFNYDFSATVTHVIDETIFGASSTRTILRMPINKAGKRSTRLECSWCRKTFVYVTAWLNHVRARHQHAITYVNHYRLGYEPWALEEDRLLLPEEYNSTVAGGVPYWSSSETESDADKTDDLRRDGKDVVDDQDDIRLSDPSVNTTQTYKNAGIALNGVSQRTIYDVDDDDFLPFECRADYEFAQWCITHRLSQSAIDDLLKNPYVQNPSTFTSSYILYKKVNEMDFPLGVESWRRGKCSFDLEEDDLPPNNAVYSPFWYRNPVDCIEWLMR